uniref:Uncharacterized protein n=1 Tax=viral metagenome TaxID=1070528 RepID=A0A6C0DEL3_9ZZZZ
MNTITKPETDTKKKVVSLILTHQARIRCLFDMITKGKRTEIIKNESIIEKIKNNRTLNNSIIYVKNTINTAQTKIANTISRPENQIKPRTYDYLEKEKQEENEEKEDEEKRFKNCSFLRLCVNRETGICLQLVYGGELDPGEGKGGRIYYIPDNDNNKSTTGGALFKKSKDTENGQVEKIIEETFININSSPTRLGLTSKDFDEGIDEYVFYIGRHGQAEHNLKRATHLITDTDLTELGKNQALRAGENLKNVLIKNREYINYVFASDLIRTRQTIENILKGMNMNKYVKKLYFPKEIIILPCSHELKYNSKGLCDKKPSSSSLSLLKIGAKENDPKCSNTTHCINNNIMNPDSDCNRIKVIIQNTENKIVKTIPLNWYFYFEKNEKKMRNMDCSKTNMIQLAIEYINTTEPVLNNSFIVIDDGSSSITDKMEIKKPVEESIVQPAVQPAVQSPVQPPEKPIVVPEQKTKRDEITKNSNDDDEKSIKRFVELFKQPRNKKQFFKDLNEMMINNKNFFYKLMDELLSIDPINLNEIFNNYKIGIEPFNVIMIYLIDTLGGTNDENALIFMNYIRNKNGELYNEIINQSPADIVDKIEKNKKGGKKTRKNRKAKKRFTKKTKRNYNNKNKNKTRRGRHKIM